MPGTGVIAAHLAQLARRLPAEVVDELADGLTETYQRHRAAGLKPAPAERAALADFGTPERIVSAFTLHSPGRRTARTLLATGPAVGALWASALITSHAWRWHISVPARIGVALVLLVLVAALASVVIDRSHYRRGQATALAAGGGLVMMDLAALVALALLDRQLTVPLALAACASLARLGYTTRQLPRLWHG